MLKLDIKPIKNFYTLLYQDKDNYIASILFPSNMEVSSSKSKCSVDFRTGILDARDGDSLTMSNTSRTLYITDATVLEMNDCLFRVAANRNYAYLNTLSFSDNVIWSFSLALQDWAEALPKEYNKCRMFGGDIIKTEMLASIYSAFKNIPDKTFYLHTSRRDILNDMIEKGIERPSNVFVFNRCLGNEISDIDEFPSLVIHTEAGHTSDIETYPTTNNDMLISLGEQNAALLRSKTPWFNLQNGT